MSLTRELLDATGLQTDAYMYDNIIAAYYISGYRVGAIFTVIVIVFHGLSYVVTRACKYFKISNSAVYRYVYIIYVVDVLLFFNIAR